MKRLTCLAVIVALLIALSPAWSARAQEGDNLLCNGLSDEDCAVLNSASAALEGITSFSVPSWIISVVIPGEEGPMTFDATGSAEFMPSEDPSANKVHLVIDEASISAPDVDESGSMEILLLGDMVYVLSDGQWYGGAATEEDAEELGQLGSLGSLDPLGELDLSASGIDMSTMITTSRGDETTVGDTAVVPYTTSINIVAVLMGALSSSLGQDLTDMLAGMVPSDSGMQLEGATPEMIMAFVPLMAPMFQGTSITVEQGIGVDDTMIHSLKLDVVFNFDMSSLSGMMGGQAAQESQEMAMEPINLEFHFYTEMADYNATFEMTPPEDYLPLEELDADLNLNLGDMEALGE